ncbi:MAG: hypothetical protein ACRDY7_05695 [Acidimicrobiia bacterium]
MTATEPGASLLLYARAQGCPTPALLMTPEAGWSVKVFSRIALSTLRADRSRPRVAVNRRTGETLGNDVILADAGLGPYDLLDLQYAD